MAAFRNHDQDHATELAGPSTTLVASGADRSRLPDCPQCGVARQRSGSNWYIDPTYGAQILRSTWDESTTPQHIEVRQAVATCDRAALPTVPISQAERQFWVAPTESAPIDGIVRTTVERIVAGRTDPRERLRAIYDWVVDTTWRDPNTPGCGIGDIKAMLETGNFGGKCVDINGLMVGLARAAGIPARDVYGIRVANCRLHPSLGKSGDISRAQHCRAEAYLEDGGWFPLDPADVQ